MDIKKIMNDTETVVLARVLELLEENPEQAKQIIKQRYDEIRGKS